MHSDVLDHDDTGAASAETARRPQRLRLWIFLPVFVVAAGVGLAFTWTRPAVYEASSRLLLDWGGSADAPDPAEVDRQFLTQCQVLTSRPLLEKVVPKLGYLGETATAGEDQVAAVQGMLTADPVEGTRVVVVRAEGPDRLFLPQLVNAVVESYEAELAAQQVSTASSEGDNLRRQIAGLEEEIAAKRQDLSALGERSDIISLQRDENRALSRLKGLQESLNKAVEAETTAAANLTAVKGAIERGEPVVRLQDQRAIADLKSRAADLHERWAELEAKYPPKRLALERDAQLLRQKLDRIQEDLAQETAASQQAALAEASQELDRTRVTRRRVEAESHEQEARVQDFSRRFQRYEAVGAELQRLEDLYQERRERLVRVDVVGQVAHQSVEVLEAAALPEWPIRPHYVRDSWIVVGGAGILGLLAVWLIEFLGHPQPAPASGSGGGLAPLLELLVRRRPEALPQQPVPLLAAEKGFPRELTAAEVATLTAASRPPVDVLIAGLLSGLAPHEVAALTWERVDVASSRVTIEGDGARTVTLSPPARLIFKQAYENRIAGSDGPLRSHDGAAPQPADLDGLLACTAHDAGLPRAEEITSEALRHTLLVHLVRQGARLAEIPHVVGPISPTLLAAYGRFAPAGPGRPLEEIDLNPPGL
jgi:succinoglycan biosynthesis transport protein ExoP